MRPWLSTTDRDASLAERLAEFEPGVHLPLHVSLQAAAEVPEHGAAAGEDDVLVEGPSHVDRAALDHVVDDLGDRRGEVRVRELRRNRRSGPGPS